MKPSRQSSTGGSFLSRVLPLRLAASFFFALYTVYSFTAYDWGLGFRANGHIYTFLALAAAGWYHKTLPLMQGRAARFALVAGGVFGLCQAVGTVVNQNGFMGDILRLWPGFWALYAVVVFYLLQCVGRADQPLADKSPQPGRIHGAFSWLLCGGPRQTLVLWVVLFACWLPYFILFYPGLVSDDTLVSMGMGLGFTPMTSHHPPLFSWALGLFLRLGGALAGQYAAGVALFTLWQMLLLGLLLALVLRYMACRHMPFWSRVAALCLYALSPAYGWYSVTLWKDVWLAAFSLAFLVLVADIGQRGVDFFRSPKRIALLAFAVMGLILAKNNGVYLFVITMVGLVLALKGCRRQLAAVLLAGVLFFATVEGPIYSALGILKGDMREALSLPLLQIAFTAKHAGESIAPADAALIETVLPFDELGALYNPMVSDSVKSRFNTMQFRTNSSAYLSLWLRLGLQFPSLYLRAFLEHTYAYFYPDADLGVFLLTPYTMYIREQGIDFDGHEPLAGRYAEPNRAAVEWVSARIGAEHAIPLVNVLVSIGFYFWVLLFLVVALLYRRQYQRLLPMLLMVAVWLVCLASPVNGSFRYGFAAVLSLPFLLGYTLWGPAPLPFEETHPLATPSPTKVD